MNRLFLSQMNPLKGEDLEILRKLVAKTQKLEDMQISFKEGGTKELKMVLQALNEKKSITFLGIFDTNALQKDEGWMEFPLNNKTLKILRVNESYIGEKCSEKLAECLEKTEASTQLDLGDRGITCFERIREALLKNNSVKRSLSGKQTSGDFHSPIFFKSSSPELIVTQVYSSETLALFHLLKKQEKCCLRFLVCNESVVRQFLFLINSPNMIHSSSFVLTLLKFTFSNV